MAYGQQRRLEIARCMVTRPALLMLDEPAAGLNPKETDELNQLIMELRNQHQVSVLLIEHDMKLVMGISDRIYVVNQERHWHRVFQQKFVIIRMLSGPIWVNKGGRGLICCH